MSIDSIYPDCEQEQFNLNKLYFEDIFIPNLKDKSLHNFQNALSRSKELKIGKRLVNDDFFCDFQEKMATPYDVIDCSFALCFDDF